MLKTLNLDERAVDFIEVTESERVGIEKQIEQALVVLEERLKLNGLGIACNKEEQKDTELLLRRIRVFRADDTTKELVVNDETIPLLNDFLGMVSKFYITEKQHTEESDTSDSYKCFHVTLTFNKKF